ncbi:MAG: hypothetical protein PS018_24240 [bacterium]|nr:hypothetical protein [bacterium]
MVPEDCGEAVLRGSKSIRRAAAAFLAAAGFVAASSAMAQSSRQEYPIPANPGQDLTAIERLFAPPPPLTAFPEFRERLKDTPAFLRDSRFNIEARSYYRDAVANAPAA